jgi:hypothetical protein
MPGSGTGHAACTTGSEHSSTTPTVTIAHLQCRIRRRYLGDL